MRVLICGAGAIGASIARCLAERGAEPVLIERAGIANAASGKSGGFLARDWCDGGPLAALARRSFDLHGVWAEESADGWGYRRLDTFAGYPGAGGPGLPWLADQVRLHGRLGDPSTTAQVHPALFTKAMARASGAEIIAGEVTGLIRHGEAVRGVAVGGEPVEGDAVVIAMGPWSILAARWLSLPAVYGLKGHSLVFRTGDAVPPQSLFADVMEADGTQQSPEVFPRADGTTYVCAISSESPLPVDPADVAPDDGAIERLETICRELSPVLARSEIVARQACYRPVTRDGLPLIGAVPGAPGAYVATGHSVWGILNAPATAEAMAELILDGRSSLDLSPFRPDRLPPATI
ncbi:MAG: FAD-dependent oxidoreductase [Alphaproteobacteria bacterium]